LEKHADFLLGLIEKQPDLTLDEVVFCPSSLLAPIFRQAAVAAGGPRGWKALGGKAR
jgi:hypothetical protein